MTLPAHRFLDRDAEGRKKGGKGGPPYVWAADFDETISKAPDQLARIAQGLKGLGDTIIVITGNESPRQVLEERLAGYGFPYDGLIQYEDDESDGLRRVAILEEIDAWCAFDDRVGRAVTYVPVCPHLFLSAEPSREAKARAGGAKDEAKLLVKKALKS
jgi:hypothetical protein